MDRRPATALGAHGPGAILTGLVGLAVSKNWFGLESLSAVDATWLGGALGMGFNFLLTVLRNYVSENPDSWLRYLIVVRTAFLIFAVTGASGALLGCGTGFIGANSLRCGNADSRCWSFSDGVGLALDSGSLELPLPIGAFDEEGNRAFVDVRFDRVSNFTMVIGEGVLVDAAGEGTQKTILGLANTVSSMAAESQRRPAPPGGGLTALPAPPFLIPLPVPSSTLEARPNQR